MRLSDFDARLLRATDPGWERTPARIGQLAGCAPDIAVNTPRRLRNRYLVQDGQRPASWLPPRHGDCALELTP
jgi:hypothetical protein